MVDVREEWRPMVGYEGYYEVSNLGQIRGVERLINCKNGTRKTIRGKVLKQSTHYKNGYKSVMVTVSGNQKRILVHRAVAIAFLENPNDLPEINHKDENKENNAVENLEWCTRQYNNSYGSAKVRGHEKQSKPVKQIKDGKVIAIYPSAMEAARQTGGTQGGISGCCRGELKTSGGYKWELA